MTQSAQNPLQIRRADVPFEEELKIMMVSCKGKLCLRPKEMVAKACHGRKGLFPRGVGERDQNFFLLFPMGGSTDL